VVRDFPFPKIGKEIGKKREKFENIGKSAENSRFLGDFGRF